MRIRKPPCASDGTQRCQLHRRPRFLSDVLLPLFLPSQNLLRNTQLLQLKEAPETRVHGQVSGRRPQTVPDHRCRSELRKRPWPRPPSGPSSPPSTEPSTQGSPVLTRLSLGFPIHTCSGTRMLTTLGSAAAVRQVSRWGLGAPGAQRPGREQGRCSGGSFRRAQLGLHWPLRST